MEIGDKVKIIKVNGNMQEIIATGIKEENVIGKIGEVISLGGRGKCMQYSVVVQFEDIGESVGFEPEELEVLSRREL